MVIAVFCASSFGSDPDFRKAAAAIGRWIGENGHSLIYGGGDAGFMGETAAAAKAARAYVTGVLPGDVPFIRDRPQTYCDEVITAENMSARKDCFIDMADAFLALPGGLGTLDEITEVMDLVRLRKLRKPAVCFNIKGYYTPLEDMLDRMKEYGFTEGNEREYVLFSDDIEEIGAFLEKKHGEGA